MTDVAWFSWGGLLSQTFHTGPVYVIGDRLLWFCDAEGVVHANSSLPSGLEVNIGSPRMRNVDVLEANGMPSKCPSCALKLAGSMVSIRDSVISEVRAVPAGRYGADILAIEIDPTTGESLSFTYTYEYIDEMPWPS